jgi:hypothetical protein
MEKLYARWKIIARLSTKRKTPHGAGLQGYASATNRRLSNSGFSWAANVTLT